jgi:hypothetical protein
MVDSVFWALMIAIGWLNDSWPELVLFLVAVAGVVLMVVVARSRRAAPPVE